MADSCLGSDTCEGQHSSSRSFWPRISWKGVFTYMLINVILLPLCWRAFGALLGWYLRKRTEGRRCHILEVVEADEKKFREERRNSTSSGEGGEDGWEKVDADVVGTAKNGDKYDDSWDGIVGFFHPFW